MNLSRLSPLPVLLVLLSACAVSSEPEPSGSSAAAICGNGVRSGCGQCAPDPSSPKGGYRTCWTCDGDSYRQACIAYATVTATWSGHAWMWTTQGPTQGDFSIPVKFEYVGRTWEVFIDTLSINAGVTVTLQSNQEGTGTVSGQSASLTLPIEAHGLDATINLATNSTLQTMDGQTITTGSYDPSTGLFQVVGADSSNSFQAFMSGTISAWPQ